MNDTIDLRIPGISRVADNEKALLLSCNRKPTDEEMIVIHDRLCARPALLNLNCSDLEQASLQFTEHNKLSMKLWELYT